jgi:hypothetical protein
LTLHFLISSASIEKSFETRLDAAEILVLTALDGGRCAPTFQFTDDAEVIPGLSSVLQALRTFMRDPWANALWLTTPSQGFDGATAVRMPLTGNVGRALKAAQQDAGFLPPGPE